MAPSLLCHHTIYIGVRLPKSSRRRRRHRRRTGHKDRKERLTANVFDKSDTENNDEASNSILRPLSKFRWTPCQC
ncbi:Electrogenic sodium bicarbonate cotransporter 1 [Xenoophorus captivus]|uniref:Electrogenic sodium bicarbonate cotransporter 1 n=1 Tax=Xenoophorus captivus TaxID=1517983 RepID=A0ABV0QTM2_9TELE